MTKNDKSRPKKKITKIIPLDLFDSLSPEFVMAIEMRLRGHKYKDIAKKVNRTEDTVKNWFYKNGVLYTPFNIRRRERQKEYKRLYQDKEKRLVELELDAYQVVGEDIRSGNAKTAIEFIKVREPSKVQHSNDPDNPILAGPIIYLPDNKRDGHNIAKPNPPRPAKT